MLSYFQANCSIYNSSIIINYEEKNLQSEETFTSTCLPISQSNPESLQYLLLYKISPYVIVIITCTNSLVCIVLSRSTMITPTNIILFAIAVSDMLTGLFPFPIYVMHYGMTKSSFFSENIYFAYISYILSTIFPTTFHTASVWLTITLAFQRVIYVKFASFITRLCTNKISIVTSIVIFILAFLMHSINYTYVFERFYQICLNNKPMFISEKDIQKTNLNFKDFSQYGKIMKCSHFHDRILVWYTSLRIIFLHIVPCVLLTILTTILLIVLKRKSNLSKRLLASKNNRKFSTSDDKVELSIYRKSQNPADNTPSRNRCNKDSSSSTSKMLVVVLIIFLMVEIPMGIVMTLYVILRILHMINVHKTWWDTTNVCNFLILISYPFNFVIYCIMSKKFRDTFKETLCPNRIYNIISNSNLE